MRYAAKPTKVIATNRYVADGEAVLDLEPNGECLSAVLVLGAAAPVPYRARCAEAALMGRRVSDDSARRAAH